MFNLLRMEPTCSGAFSVSPKGLRNTGSGPTGTIIDWSVGTASDNSAYPEIRLFGVKLKQASVQTKFRDEHRGTGEEREKYHSPNR